MKELNMNNKFSRYMILFSLLFFCLVFIILIIQSINNPPELSEVDFWIALTLGAFLVPLFYSLLVRSIIMSNNSIIINMPPRKIQFTKDDVQKCVYSGALGLKGHYFTIFLKTGKRITLSVDSKECINALLDFFDLDESASR